MYSPYPVELTLSLATSFGLFQTQRVCRQQFYLMKMAEGSPKV